MTPPPSLPIPPLIWSLSHGQNNVTPMYGHTVAGGNKNKAANNKKLGNKKSSLYASKRKPGQLPSNRDTPILRQNSGAVRTMTSPPQTPRHR